jgi:hypothetical protein
MLERDSVRAPFRPTGQDFWSHGVGRRLQLPVLLRQPPIQAPLQPGGKAEPVALTLSFDQGGLEHHRSDCGYEPHTTGELGLEVRDS